MRAFIAILFGFLGLSLLMAGIEFIGNNYSDFLGPVFLLAGIAALITWAVKKGI
jgi:hypothetical protein